MRRKPSTRSIAATLCLTAALGMSGCREALFTDRDVRSQYDRYDRVRNQYEPVTLRDEFGAPTPNIKGRLSPKR